MTSKCTFEDGGKSDTDDPSTAASKLPTSEQKEVSGRRPRRPRAGHNDASNEAISGVERPYIKTIEGGWELDAGPASSDAQKKSFSRDAEFQDPKKLDGARGARRSHFDNDETEILVIPDLEDDAEDEGIAKVAVAPRNTTRRLPSLRELDEDLRYSVPSAAEGLDMSLLTTTLVPPDLLEEDDSIWEFDGLLQTVTQEFNAQLLGSRRHPHPGTFDDPKSKASGERLGINSRSRSSRALVS